MWSGRLLLVCCALAVLVLLCDYHQAHALNNGLGLTPQMGWNSWNKYGCDIDEDVVRGVADAFVTKGLKAAGYEYVNLDDCVFIGRDASGTLIADPKKFPSGIKALADYVHSKGLKFGIYTDAGYKTCQGRPGIYGYETKDADTFAGFGVDYLKVDWCNTGGMTPRDRYPKIRDALLASGRPIFFSMCEWGVDEPWSWAMPVGNSWRTTGDIDASWNRMVQIVDAMRGLGKYAGPGGWNDPDMLEIGNGEFGDRNMTAAQAHMSLWSLMNAPLLAGNDIVNMDPRSNTTMVLTNPEVIAINQDKLGVAGDIRVDNGSTQIWSKQLVDGQHAVVMFNKNSSPVSLTLNYNVLVPTAGHTYLVRDLWARDDLGSFNDSVTLTVPGRGVRMLRLHLLHDDDTQLTENAAN